MIDLSTINGCEIVDYLNSQIEAISKTSMSGPIIFEKQRYVAKGNYELWFTCFFNNWGTDQAISNNIIRVCYDGSVYASLNEPFDGDNSCEVIEDLIRTWILHPYIFTDQTQNFKDLVSEVNESLNSITINDIAKMTDIIKNLTRALTMMK